MLFSMKHVSKSGSRSNLTFFGDIIGDVSIAPFKSGYQIIKHPSSNLAKTSLSFGPLIAPSPDDEGKLERVPGPDRMGVAGELAWKEFTELEPNSNSFLEFANKYGLLGTAKGVVLSLGETAVGCDPLVDWFHHYCKLRLLRVVFDNLSNPELVDFIENEQKKLHKTIRPRFSTIALGQFNERPQWIDETGIWGAQVGTMFQPSVWNFPSGLSKLQLIQSAFDQLSHEISTHTRIKVRHRGRRNTLNMGDDTNAKGLMETVNDFIITTTLEPDSLIGAMYAGILLKVCNYHIRRNLRPCLHCGGSILSPHKLRRYCSERCKQRAKREREAAESVGANPNV